MWHIMFGEPRKPFSQLKTHKCFVKYKGMTIWKKKSKKLFQAINVDKVSLKQFYLLPGHQPPAARTRFSGQQPPSHRNQRAPDEFRGPC